MPTKGGENAIDVTFFFRCPNKLQLRGSDTGPPTKGIREGAGAAWPKNALWDRPQKVLNYGPRFYLSLTRFRYSEAVSLVHAILGVRASPYVFLRAVGFPGSHGPVTTMAGKG